MTLIFVLVEKSGCHNSWESYHTVASLTNYRSINQRPKRDLIKNQRLVVTRRLPISPLMILNVQFQDKQKEEPESPAPTAVAPSLPGPSTLTNSVQHHEEAEDALECLELPPPMKPIQDPSQIVGDDNCIQTTNPSNSKANLDESDLAEIEQIVKEKMVSSSCIWNLILWKWSSHQ